MFPLRAWLDRVIPFYGSQICFSDGIFSLVLVVWLFAVTGKKRERAVARQIEENLQHRMNEFEAQRQEKSKQIRQEQVQEFCQHYHLTERETEILRLILDGKSNQEISEELYITVGTVKAHIHSIFGKLEISRRSQLMMQFVNHGAK